MPTITVCQSCHGGEKATDKVPSTCVDCHRFHRKDMDPMHPEKAAEAHKDMLPQNHPKVASAEGQHE